MTGITGPKKDEIIMRQLCHFFRANEELGRGVAEGLGVDMSSIKTGGLEPAHS
jgi:catalase